MTRRSPRRARRPPTAAPPLLEVEDIHTFYGSIEALKGISISVHEGEIVTLIGANGAGKSTTLRSISGIVPPRTGRIVFQGAEIQGLAGHEVAEIGIAQSPEGRRIFPRMTVLENLEMGAFTRRDQKADPRGHRPRLRPLPAPEGARAPEGRHDVRRRAADAGHRAARSWPSPSCCCSTSRRWASRR